MKKVLVKNLRGEKFELTPDEIKFYRAVKRLDKLNQGRLCLFGNGDLSIRINNTWYDDTIYFLINVKCEGGDGGDNW